MGAPEIVIGLHPITATLGAEVSGVDLADMDGATFDQLRKAWMDHKVLVIRDQHITREQHMAFGRRFGDLEVHPFVPDETGGTLPPEIVRLESSADRQVAASIWHSDVTWRREPSMGSILRGVVIPQVGGDTVFSDTTAAYERLPERWKDRIDGLSAIHDFTASFGQGLSPEELVQKQEEYPPTSHPVIRTHPETGARGIYTNRNFVSHVQGVGADESRAIVNRLQRAIMDPSVQCRIRWEVDMFVMWDNRCVQHFATNDYWPEARVVERVTIVGDRPF